MSSRSLFNRNHLNSPPPLLRRFSHPPNLSTTNRLESITRQSYSHDEASDIHGHLTDQHRVHSPIDDGRKRLRESDHRAHHGKRRRLQDGNSSRVSGKTTHMLSVEYKSKSEGDIGTVESESKLDDDIQCGSEVSSISVDRCITSQHTSDRSHINIFSPFPKTRKRSPSPNVLDRAVLSDVPNESTSHQSEDESSASDVSSGQHRKRSKSPGVSSLGAVTRRPTALIPFGTRAGFRNVGNSCYISCILAALYSVSQFTEKMKEFGTMVRQIISLRQALELSSSSKTYLTRTSLDEYKIPGSGLFNAIVGLAIDFQVAASRTNNGATVGTRGTTIDIGMLKSLVNELCPFFSGFEQHDAHEFLLIILDTMEEQIAVMLRELIQEPTQKKELKETSQEIVLTNNDVTSDTVDRDHRDFIQEQLIEIEKKVGLNEIPPSLFSMRSSEESKMCDTKETDIQSQYTMNIPSSSDINGDHTNLYNRPKTSVSGQSSPKSLRDDNQFSSNNHRLYDDQLKFLIPSVQMISGSVTNILTCQQCGYKRSNGQTFRILTLNIPVQFSPPKSIDGSNSIRKSYLEELTLTSSRNDMSKYPPIDLEELLDYFVRFDLLECRCDHGGCSATRVGTTHRFSKCPKIMLLHINRIIPKSSTENSYSKIRRAINIPLILSLFPYTTNNDKALTDDRCHDVSQSPIKDDDLRVVITVHHSELPKYRSTEDKKRSPLYALRSVISHIGQRQQSGHFVCYIRDQNSGFSATSNTVSSDNSESNDIGSDNSPWYCHNDSDVRVVAPSVVERVVQRDGYIIVYEQIG